MALTRKVFVQAQKNNQTGPLSISPEAIMHKNNHDVPPHDARSKMNFIPRPF